MNYTFYVDESGQAGIKKIRTKESGGASPYLTLGGVLVPESEKDRLTGLVLSLAKEFSKPNLHCSKLNHNQIVRFSKELAQARVKLFGVISLKATLGDYANEINHSDKAFYNKNAQYLLERLAHFLELKGIEDKSVSIVFEEGNFDYHKLKALIGKCVHSPQKAATKRLKGRINPSSIKAVPKDGDPLLQLADLAAHALYRLVDDSPSTYGVQEVRYVSELRSKFFSDPSTGLVCGAGIFPVHRLKQIKAEGEVEAFLSELSAK